MKKIFVLFAALLRVHQLFASGNMELVNDRTIDMSEIETLHISYDSDNVFLFKSNDNNLILKEYMTRGTSIYYADVENSNGILSSRSLRIAKSMEIRGKSL